LSSLDYLTWPIHLPYSAFPDLRGRERGTGASAAGRISAIRPIEHPAVHLSALDQTKT